MRIYLASSPKDIQSRREEARKALATLTPRVEVVTPRENETTEERNTLINNCDLVLAILGQQYGEIPKAGKSGDGVSSLTWLQIRASDDAGKPIIVLLPDPTSSYFLTQKGSLHEAPQGHPKGGPSTLHIAPELRDEALKGIPESERPKALAEIEQSLNRMQEWLEILPLKYHYTDPKAIPATAIQAIKEWRVDSTEDHDALLLEIDDESPPAPPRLGYQPPPKGAAHAQEQAQAEPSATTSSKHTVFISFSTNNLSEVNEIDEAIFANGIVCWKYYGRIRARKNWRKFLINQIDTSAVFLLVLSAESNASPDVIREVVHASERVDAGLLVAPVVFRLDNTRLDDELRYIVNRIQYVNPIVNEAGWRKDIPALIKAIQEAIHEAKLLKIPSAELCTPLYMRLLVKLKIASRTGYRWLKGLGASFGLGLILLVVVATILIVVFHDYFRQWLPGIPTAPTFTRPKETGPTIPPKPVYARIEVTSNAIHMLCIKWSPTEPDVFDIDKDKSKVIPLLYPFASEAEKRHGGFPVLANQRAFTPESTQAVVSALQVIFTMSQLSPQRVYIVINSSVRPAQASEVCVEALAKTIAQKLKAEVIFQRPEKESEAILASLGAVGLKREDTIVLWIRDDGIKVAVDEPGAGPRTTITNLPGMERIIDVLKPTSDTMEWTPDQWKAFERKVAAYCQEHVKSVLDTERTAIGSLSSKTRRILVIGSRLRVLQPGSPTNGVVPLTKEQLDRFTENHWERIILREVLRAFDQALGFADRTLYAPTWEPDLARTQLEERIRQRANPRSSTGAD